VMVTNKAQGSFLTRWQHQSRKLWTAFHNVSLHDVFIKRSCHNADATGTPLGAMPILLWAQESDS
jgi:hypothetical protein